MSLYQVFTQEYLKKCHIKGPSIKNLQKNIKKGALLRVLISRIYKRIFKKVPYEGSLYQGFTQEYLKTCLIKGPYIKKLHKNI